MKRTNLSIGLLRSLLVLASCLMYGAAIAHHSFADFDTDTSKTIHGVVKEIWFKNPHVRYYITVKEENGDESVWDAHTSSVNVLVRHGWMKDSIKVGDEVDMIGSPAKDGAPRLMVHTVKLSNGVVVSSRGN